MNNSLQKVSLGKILKRSEEWIDIRPDKQYRQVTVKLWGKGVVLRDEVNGTEIAADRRFVIRSQQFILSRIDARNGAFGIVPDSLDGAVVSTDFPVFTLDCSRILPKFLEWMSKTHDFIDLCKAASEGTTNRIRLKEDRFLAAEIPLPSLEEQRRIVARIEELAARIEEARGLRRVAVEKTELLFPSALESLFEGNDEDWRYEKLAGNGLATVIAGQHIMAEEYNLSGDGIPYLTGPADFGTRVAEIKRWTLTPKSTSLPGDILLTVKGAGVGKINFTPDVEVAIGRQLMAIRPDPSRLLREFVYFFLEHKFEHFRSIATATTVPGFRKIDVEELCIPVPVLTEQHYIVSYLVHLQSKVDSLKQLQSETSAELDTLLPSILDKAFKGDL